MNVPLAVAEFLYRFRHAFVVFVVLGAALLAPRANLTSIDNDLSAWTAKDDPAYQTYERFREEFGGTRTLIVALRSDRIFTPEGLEFIARLTSELERVELVERVSSLASANIVRPLAATADDDGGIRRCDRSTAVGDLQLQHPSRRAARVVEDAGRDGPDGADLTRSRATAVCAESELRRIVCQACKSTVEWRRSSRLQNPGSAEAIAQELFVFGLSEEGRLELSRVVASDYSRAQIAVKLASMSSDLVFEQIRQAETLAARTLDGSGVVPTVTGSGRIFSTLDHYLVISQLSSFGTAFLTVFGVIFIVFRSARFGVLGIVANIFPVVIVLGLMGWLDISLNVATVMVASVTLGIVDDDTIHFIGRFRREIAGGAETRPAVETAAMHEGRAALTTTIINALGYTVLMVSEYRPTAWFGSLLATTMVLAFLAEVFIVPAVISLFPRVYGAPAIARRLGTAA